MIDYTKAQREYPIQKRALTRAINSGRPLEVVRATRKAVAQWNASGAWPDGWHRWDQALQDARHLARRMGLNPKISDYDINLMG